MNLIRLLAALCVWDLKGLSAAKIHLLLLRRRNFPLIQCVTKSTLCVDILSVPLSKSGVILNNLLLRHPKYSAIHLIATDCQENKIMKKIVRETEKKAAPRETAPVF